MNWRVKAKGIASLGSVSKKASSLADIHRRREETQGQYFTPDWVARGIWQTLGQVVRRKSDCGARLSVLDSSMGSGALFEGAPLEHAYLCGIDTDGRCVDALSEDAAKAELMYEFIRGGLEDLEAYGFTVATINPSFSLTLSSPNLHPYDCTSFGKFGQGTSALSHEYALEHALGAASVVAALLPSSMDEFCKAQDNLRLIVRLPRNTFSSEGANVDTSVYFYGSGQSSVVEHRIKKGSRWPVLEIPRGDTLKGRKPVFRMMGIEVSEPVITLPVTGDRRVTLHHHGKRVVLHYKCGLTQARVANGLLVSLAESKRVPKDITYRGDGKFSLDLMLLQDEPESQLQRLASEIESHGGEPVITPTLEGFYRKMVKKHKRAIVPMYRMARVKGDEVVSLIAKRRQMLDPNDLNSVSVSKGSCVQARVGGGQYELTYQGETCVLRHDEVFSRYTLQTAASNDHNWKVLHKGLNAAYPEVANCHGKTLDRLGINWLADFQRSSIIEGLISPYGFISAWEQGSGKSRGALALCLAHSGCNMLVVESGLVPEMMREVKALGIGEGLWKLLKSGEMPTAKINIATYSLLRKKIGQKTNAKLWRRQINLLVCDEGGLLANENTQQSRAVRALAARKIICQDGTAMRNYPRDLLPLSVVSAGNGRAHQPYGIKGKAYLEPRLLQSCTAVQRGEDAFLDDYVVYQWVTNMFREDLRSGSRREVPRINNLTSFRQWIAPNIQRRLRIEPDLAVFNNCPPPKHSIHTIDWDNAHFEHYMKVAKEFANWYRTMHKEDGQKLNLITVLARIGAVQRAANSPHVMSKNSMAGYFHETSKQRHAIARIKHWVDAGRKTILYAHSPDVLERMQTTLRERHGLESVLFTGNQDIKQRTIELDREFREGDTQVLLCSMVGIRGLNLPMASCVILYERGWSSAGEEQAIYRTQRPSQKSTVEVEKLHLRGGIDEYCAQLIDWKSKAAQAGLDFGEQHGEDEEFQHLDTILLRFCGELEELEAGEACAA